MGILYRLLQSLQEYEDEELHLNALNEETMEECMGPNDSLVEQLLNPVGRNKDKTL